MTGRRAGFEHSPAGAETLSSSSSKATSASRICGGVILSPSKRDTLFFSLATSAFQSCGVILSPSKREDQSHTLKVGLTDCRDWRHAERRPVCPMGGQIGKPWERSSGRLAGAVWEGGRHSVATSSSRLQSRSRWGESERRRGGGWGRLSVGWTQVFVRGCFSRQVQQRLEESPRETLQGWKVCETIIHRHQYWELAK